MDTQWMEEALAEAKKGWGLTSPNPPVGAVIVKEGELLGKGYHQKAGQPHAEVCALTQVVDKERLKGATLYVTLEPCSTTGKTPPCTQMLIEAGIKRVVYGATDPHPAHCGKADHLLTEVGIEVVKGVLEEACRHLIRPFAKWITTGMPYVIAKTAMTLDGRTTRPGETSPWISSAASREEVHRLRNQVDAILVGGETVRTDNPRLTIRGKHKHPDKAQPRRVILTRQHNLPQDRHVFTDAHKERTSVYHSPQLKEVLQDLGKKEVLTILVESGGKLLCQFLEQELVDELQLYIAPFLGGSGNQAFAAESLAGLEKELVPIKVHYERFDNDIKITSYLK